MTGLRTRYSYRFLFAPGTIGAITWLARNEDNSQRIKHGLVISMVGDGGGPTYKKSRRGNAKIDRAMIHSLHHSGLTPTILDFSPYGYDERQYCSPGFNLPVGLFQRSRFGAIPQYHTSADNLDFIRPDHLSRSYRLIVETLDVIENDAVYCNTMPKCEPQLGKRGLYGAVGGTRTPPRQIWPCYGFSISPTGRIRCSTSRSVRNCLSRLCGAPQSSSKTAAEAQLAGGCPVIGPKQLEP